MTGVEIQLFLRIIALGLDVANQVLGFDVTDHAIEFRDGFKEESVQQQQLSVQQLRDLINSSNLSLKEAISVGIDKIIGKIEQDKVEELISRINNIDLLLRMRKDDQLLPYVLQLRESVDYAKNRLLEGKDSWLMPYMVGLGMVCATFSYLGEKDLSTSQEFEKLVLDAKKTVLTEVTKILLNQGQEIPWELVKKVLNNQVGAIEKYVALLPDEAPRRLPDPTSRKVKTGSWINGKFIEIKR